ncbi:Uncharacterised protein [Amycolatopsis camponoti]|uniref:Uncharacterized protein n=1 Tax=Amycolatopsis camponoti TaxID=2606593 RepID=A0A6I8LLR5_9PSEU|nr:Uncharacterised protein [Amycolatopsis camponoti]
MYAGCRNRLPYRSAWGAVRAPGRDSSVTGWLNSELSIVEEVIGDPFVETGEDGVIDRRSRWMEAEEGAGFDTLAHEVLSDTTERTPRLRGACRDRS